MSAKRVPGRAEGSVPEACGPVPIALRAVQMAKGRSNSPSRVPEDNGTQIISAANEQYKIALRAVQGRRAFQKPAAVPIALRAVQMAKGRSK